MCFCVLGRVVSTCYRLCHHPYNGFWELGCLNIVILCAWIRSFVGSGMLFNSGFCAPVCYWTSGRGVSTYTFSRRNHPLHILSGSWDAWDMIVFCAWLCKQEGINIASALWKHPVQELDWCNIFWVCMSAWQALLIRGFALELPTTGPISERCVRAFLRVGMCVRTRVFLPF